MNDLILHPEYESLGKEVEALKGDIASMRTRIDRIQNVEALFYRTKYNNLFGKLEQEISRKYYQYRLMKRKLEMIQAALNRKATPDMDSINLILTGEADEYNAILQKKAAELKELSLLEFRDYSPEEIAQSKALYQKIVRALHPDLNPAATEDDCKILQQAVEAFSSGDVATLDALYAVLEISGKLKPAPSSGSMEELNALREKLTKTAESLAMQIAKLNNSFPMNQVELLSDEEQIAKKQKELEKLSAEYDEILDDYIQRIAPFERNNSK